VNSLQQASAHIVRLLLAITIIAIPFGSLLYMAEQGVWYEPHEINGECSTGV
jgi:hypothetical protein